MTGRTVLRRGLATLLIGAAGSGLWELLFRPGLTRGGRVVLNIITLGSARIRDWAYQSAAFDPTALPSLAMLFLLVFFPIFVALAWGLLAPIDESEGAFIIAFRKWPTRNRRGFLSVLLTYWLLFAVIPAIVLNQAVIIRRAFFTNLSIVSPFVDDTAEEHLIARFSRVHTKSEYEAIHEDMRKLAARNHTSLADPGLW